jgi:hypothetical protein
MQGEGYDHDDHSGNLHKEEGVKRKAFKIRNRDKEDEDLLKVVIKKVASVYFPRSRMKKHTTISS